MQSPLKRGAAEECRKAGDTWLTRGQVTGTRGLLMLVSPRAVFPFPMIERVS